MCFDSNSPLLLRCTSKWCETEDCVSLQLTSETSQPFNFKPGQFVTIGIEIAGKVHYRAYSISSIPGETHLQLTVKRVPQGLVSNYIVDELTVGDSVQCLAPAGDFNSVDCAPLGDTQKVLLISAGCGITPVYSMAKQWLAQKSDIEIDFLHIAKSTQHTIYFEQLQQLAKANTNFQLKLLLKDAGESDFPQGRLNLDWLNSLVGDLNQRDVYLCGPNQFMLDVKQYLEQSGFDMQRFYQESFTPAESEPQQNESEGVTQNSVVQIALPAFDKTLEAAAGSNLADVMEQAGLPVIIACRSGICGSCKCKVTSGNVDSSSQSPLTEDEIAQGYVLACSSTLNSDIAIEL